MSAQHTPGPWTVAPPNHDPDNGETLKRHWTVRAPGRTSAILSFQLALISSLGTDHEEADARLIAAAPDMLAALQELVRIRDWVALAGGTEGPLPQDVIHKFAEQQMPAIDAARAAIAQATGRAS